MESDPFEKAKKIRKGELDDERPSYEEMTGWITRMPVTYLPGLLHAIVAACVHRGVFQTGKLIGFVGRCERQANEPGGGAFRDDV